jgi:hypothetical protein
MDEGWEGSQVEALRSKNRISSALCRRADRGAGGEESGVRRKASNDRTCSADPALSLSLES